MEYKILDRGSSKLDFEVYTMLESVHALYIFMSFQQISVRLGHRVNDGVQGISCG